MNLDLNRESWTFLEFPIDSFGNLYITDKDNQSVRKVDSTGTITTVAASVGVDGFCGEGGLKPRGDGLTWNCTDALFNGGRHFCSMGTQKVAKMLLDFFKSDATTKPWFLTTP